MEIFPGFAEWHTTAPSRIQTMGTPKKGDRHPFILTGEIDKKCWEQWPAGMPVPGLARWKEYQPA